MQDETDANTALSTKNENEIEALDLPISGPPGGFASGDLYGAYPSPRVGAIQGRTVYGAPPTDGQVLLWDAAGDQWQPGERIVTLSVATADATPALMLDASGSQGIAMLDNSVYLFEALIVGKEEDVSNSAAYLVRFAAQRGVGAASAVALGAIPAVTLLGEDTAGFDAAASVNVTNGAIDVTVTGAAATAMNWLAKIRVVELISVS